MIARAMAEAQIGGAAALAFDEPPTLSITAVAVAPGGARFTRHAVVRLNGQQAAGPNAIQYQVLDWDDGGG